MREVVIRLKTGATWASEMAAKHSATIRILECKPSSQDDGMYQFAEIVAPPDALRKTISDICACTKVTEVFLEETKSGRGVGSVRAKSMICGKALPSNVFCRTCLINSKVQANGETEWTLAFPDTSSLTQLLQRLTDLGADPKILRLGSFADSATLTQLQEELIEKAFDEGFFDNPRGITMRQLARIMGVSAAAVSEMIRRAERKALVAYRSLNIARPLSRDDPVKLSRKFRQHKQN